VGGSEEHPLRDGLGTNLTFRWGWSSYAQPDELTKEHEMKTSEPYQSTQAVREDTEDYANAVARIFPPREWRDPISQGRRTVGGRPRRSASFFRRL
jgi:hypothetical protein